MGDYPSSQPSSSQKEDDSRFQIQLIAGKQEFLVLKPKLLRDHPRFLVTKPIKSKPNFQDIRKNIIL
ncbi:hypothetical protein WICPIJ_003690 [Wickerhamomyces pijperi]|uniref:Uncharacterized protein n=1 Tax=Wickerhamomyces pijperi TaxID=599730 RepID=A0A9P8TMS7_WICPI|nr:hypothetical protein WICPIJ_003690 [Wickerhamomyces pijperi]